MEEEEEREGERTRRESRGGRRTWLHPLRCATGQALMDSPLSLLRLHARSTNREISAHRG